MCYVYNVYFSGKKFTNLNSSIPTTMQNKSKLMCRKCTPMYNLTNG